MASAANFACAVPDDGISFFLGFRLQGRQFNGNAGVSSEASGALIDESPDALATL
jgi:hypothetical protein